jgi:hypothetical protein
MVSVFRNCRYVKLNNHRAFGFKQTVLCAVGISYLQFPVNVLYIETSQINFNVLLPCTVIQQYSRTNKMRFLYSVYCELTVSICFEHYFLIFRRSCINKYWYIAGISRQNIIFVCSPFTNCPVFLVISWFWLFLYRSKAFASYSKILH